MALGRDPTLTDLQFKFFFIPAGEGEESEIEIHENDFNGDPESGHPLPGDYIVRVINGAGLTVLEETGFWEKPAVREDNKPVAESLGAYAKSLVGMAHAQADKATMSEARMRDTVEYAKERARIAEDERDAMSSAMKTLKDENLQFQKQRDEAFIERDRAYEREAATEAELEAYQQRGGELRPLMETMAAKGVDRVAELLGLMPAGTSEHTEAFEKCQEELVQILMQERLEDLLSYAQSGVLPWNIVRYLIVTYYGVDPGPEPVDPDWTPPQPEVVDEEAEDEAEAAE